MRRPQTHYRPVPCQSLTRWHKFQKKHPSLCCPLTFESFVRNSQRSGEIRVLSFKVIITLMCRGHLEDKYRCKRMHFFLYVDSLLHEPLFSVKLGAWTAIVPGIFICRRSRLLARLGRIVSIVPLIDSAPPSSFSLCYGVDSIDWPESL